MWQNGPVPHSREERLSLARAIAERARQRFSAIAVAAYGSLARGEDGPYSDIEMICVVPGETDENFEWIHDGWKVEVNLRGRDRLLCDGATVEGEWSVTHANYLRLMPLFDPDGFFARLAETVQAVPEEKFRDAMNELIVGEIYEAVGKVRNARALPTPGFGHYFVKLGYFLVGLAHRRTWSTATRAVAESLLLPDLPDGYAALCEGDFSVEAVERFWRGVAHWASARGLAVESAGHMI
jgi:kanamycin nucleotidyltransferase